MLGIAGMVGSGRTELAELLFGVEPADSGEIMIRGKKVQHPHALDAIREQDVLHHRRPPVLGPVPQAFHR